jgi:hypothetical protein
MSLATGGIGRPVALAATRGLGRKIVSRPRHTALPTGGLGNAVQLLVTRGIGRSGALVVPPDIYFGGGPERSETYRPPWSRRRWALHAGQMYAPQVYRQIDEERRKKRTPEEEKRGERLVLDIEGTEIEIRPSKGPSLSRELKARAKPDVLIAIMAELGVGEDKAKEALRARIKLEREALNAWRKELIDDEELLLLLMVI